MKKWEENKLPVTKQKPGETGKSDQCPHVSDVQSPWWDPAACFTAGVGTHLKTRSLVELVALPEHHHWEAPTGPNLPPSTPGLRDPHLQPGKEVCINTLCPLPRGRVSP